MRRAEVLTTGRDWLLHASGAGTRPCAAGPRAARALHSVHSGFISDTLLIQADLSSDLLQLSVKLLHSQLAFFMVFFLVQSNVVPLLHGPYIN